MSYLANSTHFNNWIFTPEELARVHRLRQLKAKKTLRLEHTKSVEGTANATGADGLKPARKARSFAALVPKSSTATRDIYDWNDTIEMDMEQEEEKEEKEGLQVEPLLEFLSIEQEALIREFYEQKVQQSCSTLFRTSDKVKSSAVMLYKRFYLSNSVMEFHPKYIVPTAIYVAGKVEEQYISVDTVAEQLDVDHKHVIGHEMILLEGVRFQLIMYHPFRSLLGFVDDLRAFNKAKGRDLPLDTLQKLHSNSCAVVNELLLTDLPLTMYPSYVSLGSLAIVVDELAKESESSGTSSVIQREHVLDFVRQSKFAKSENVEDVFKQLETIAQAYATLKAKEAATASGQPEAAEKDKQIKKLYKKLKKFHEGNDGKDKKKDDKESKKRKSDGKKDDKKKSKKHKKEKK
ncbi:TPA: hypothetical protein N0F65_002204 [Lagenidium giganteum]|uniref:Cyclin-like domain-containing protein n=1 Tax=Lagenidium giganteum TaxID=4803 RepID=A0AAV2YHS3_9STRA|nr:TPA: hypothetical protein N0F65_002204 [Lagenidium giganteum]